MVSLRTFALAALTASATAKSAVIDLIPSNFDDIVLKSGTPSLVEFFAPWCGHCKNLAPVYEELAAGLESQKGKVTIAKVDADAEKSLGQRFGIQGFPTLKWFDGKSDKPEDYNGGRDLESLNAFIAKKTGVKPKKKAAAPSAIEFLTDATFQKTIGSDKDVLVAFTAPWCGHCKTLAPIWEEVALDFKNDAGVIIAKVDAEDEKSKATAQAQGITSYPTIKFFRKGSTEGEAYNGGRTEKEIVDFINAQSGTYRVPGGSLNTIAGTIEALDSFVTKYTGGATIAEVAEEVKQAALGYKEKASYKYAEYYVKVFEKLSASDNFAAKELKRLDSILQKGHLAPEKRDEFTSKTNILRRFVEKVVGKEEL